MDRAVTALNALSALLTLSLIVFLCFNYLSLRGGLRRKLSLRRKKKNRLWLFFFEKLLSQLFFQFPRALYRKLECGTDVLLIFNLLNQPLPLLHIVLLNFLHYSTAPPRFLPTLPLLLFF